jgi:hypothetical protein
MTCARCGASLAPGASFCAMCGARIAGAAGAPADPLAAPPPAISGPPATSRAPAASVAPPALGPEPRPLEALSVASIILGALAWLTLPVLGALAAVITGHLARGEIRRSNGRLRGTEFATVGLILGYLQLALVLLAVLFVLGIVALGLHSSRFSL